MMKEITPVAIKKRRRENSTANKDDANVTASRTLNTNLVPPDIWVYEEQEADRRTAETDLMLYRETCDEIRKIMRGILELKSKKKVGVDGEIAEKRIQASLLFISLKKLNRLEKLKSKKFRDATNEAKHRVDNFQLQLQNLLYESLHLKKEVDKCVEFKSKDEEIELVSVDEFYVDAPPQISKVEITKKNAHQLMLARLHWELEQRKQLSEKCEEACKLKEKTVAEIKVKREHLDDLAPRLTSILQATLPLQDYLNMPLNATRLENKLCGLLPRPLFILHVHAAAYREACDNKMSVAIEGDIDEARAVSESAEEEDDDSDSDVDESCAEKRHRRRSIDRVGNNRKKLLSKHPLSVVVSIKCHGDRVLVLNFSYITLMHIVTVSSTLKCSEQHLNEGVASEILAVDLLLTCLFPGDTGDDTPNLTNHYQLQKLGMKAFSEYIDELGRPFRWAQLLAGMEFPLGDDDQQVSLHTSVTCQQSVVASHIAQIVTAIRDRVDARFSLQQQILSLAKGIVPASPTGLSAKVTSRLVSWKIVMWEEFMTAKQRLQLVEDGLLSRGSILFVAQIERGSAKLRAQVSISPEYPSIAPIFFLSVSWKDERDAQEDTALRIMEREINVFCTEMATSKDAVNRVLTSQVQQLLMCFDVYLETNAANSAFEGPVEFPKEKIFIRAHSGRDRSKPYRFVSQYGFFSHR